MPLTSEQVKELKKQLSEQIKNLPKEEKAEAQKQIDSMSSQALETMIKQQQAQSGIFRKIVSKEIPSKIIDENQEGLAVLEIRPVSDGHSIVIPKKQVKETKNVPPSLIEFSKRVADKLTKSLNAKRVEIRSQNLMGEVIINLIPVYDRQIDANSPRNQASEESLEKVREKILSYKEMSKAEAIKPIKVRKKKIPLIKIKRRIP